MLLYGRWTERWESAARKLMTKCLATPPSPSNLPKGTTPYSHILAARWSTHEHTHAHKHRKPLIGNLCSSVTMA